MTSLPNTRPRVTFDAGVLIALDRNSVVEWALLRRLGDRQVLPTVPAPVITEVWRSSRQANLARALKRCRVEDTDAKIAQAAGELCAASGTDDPVDAIVVASAAQRGDVIWTSDPDDLRRLAAHVDGVTVRPLKGGS